MIIFLDNYLDETVDFELFEKKVSTDIRLINEILNEILESYVCEGMELPGRNENFNKLAFSILHRFNKFLNRFADYVTDFQVSYDPADILFISNELTKKIKLINSIHLQKEVKRKNKQYINENEYAILFKSLEE